MKAFVPGDILIAQRDQRGPDALADHSPGSVVSPQLPGLKPTVGDLGGRERAWGLA